MGRAMLGRIFGSAAIAVILSPSAATAQATTRHCLALEEAGPACLIARQQLPSLPVGKIFWHIDRFRSKEAAEGASTPTGVVLEAFAATWLFTLAQSGWRSRGGEHVSIIGPLPVAPASTYAAEYLRSIFDPGATAPLHVHSGPEAFYAVSGDTCLETPDGVQIGRGPGNSLIIKAGVPMLLMAISKVPRQGFALILHDANQPPTTLTQAWHPQGLCTRQLSLDQGR
jgi:quercetin dioxygenase-like cupin family protein